MTVQAHFIGGPWDGMVIAVREVYPFYEIAEMGEVQAWVPTGEGEGEFVQPRTVRYTLYDTWPVKYVLEGSTMAHKRKSKKKKKPNPKPY